MEDVQFQPPEPAEPAEPGDTGYMLTCGERDIFDEDVTYTVSQLMADLDTPTQEDPGVPARSSEVEEALKPVPIKCWASESEQDSTMDTHRRGRTTDKMMPVSLLNLLSLP